MTKDQDKESLTALQLRHAQERVDRYEAHIARLEVEKKHANFKLALLWGWVVSLAVFSTFFGVVHHREREHEEIAKCLELGGSVERTRGGHVKCLEVKP